MAGSARTSPTQYFLLGIPLHADYLEEGLDTLGYSVEVVEGDVLRSSDITNVHELSSLRGHSTQLILNDGLEAFLKRNP